MSIYRARLRNTSNALSTRVSSEQIRLQVPPKLFGVDNNSITTKTRQSNPCSHVLMKMIQSCLTHQHLQFLSQLSDLNTQLIYSALFLEFLCHELITSLSLPLHLSVLFQLTTSSLAHITVLQRQRHSSLSQ